MSDFDVIIVGGGIAGASLGAEIATRRRTLIIEAEDQCGYHTTGRSAAFWLAHYGGPAVMPLTLASGPLLEQGWPTGDRSWLRRRGAITIARHYMDLREALSMNSRAAPLSELKREELEDRIPGLRGGWDYGAWDPSCADIDVAGLHHACLTQFRRSGGRILCSTALSSARRWGDQWVVEAGSERLTANIIVNSAGAWADEVAGRCGARPLGIRPYRRTITQLRIGRFGLRDLPLINDALESFYFKGEADNRVWVSPHDETASDPCDAAPEELDVATAIDRFQSVVDWPIEAVERSWAGLRSFAPDRLPVFGFDSVPGFFWCAGQGGFGIQTAPAAARLCAAMLLGEELGDSPAHAKAAAFSPLRFSSAGQ
ncbi:MAG: FAD-dependent oxidoreductase [Sphingomicrobium sp.]